MDVLPTGDQLCGNGYTACCLDLVTRQHPNFDTSVAKQLQRGLDIPLEAVFHTGDAEKFKVSLQVLADHLGHADIASLQSERGLLVLGGELFVLLRR